MRIHPVNFLIAVVASALLAFGLTNSAANAMKLTVCVGSFVFLASTLAATIGFTYEHVRSGVNLRIFSFIAFLAALLLNTILVYYAFSITSYIGFCGISFLCYVLIANAIYGVKQ